MLLRFVKVWKHGRLLKTTLHFTIIEEPVWNNSKPALSVFMIFYFKSSTTFSPISVQDRLEKSTPSNFSNTSFASCTFSF